MKNPSRLFAIIVVVIGLIAAAILLQPTVEEQLAPDPHTAWVAIATAGSDLAKVGSVDLDIGAEFTLHAVLEARDRNDQPVYYTNAKRLLLEGQEVPAERLKTWQRRQPIKVRWFTVEGIRPFVELGNESGIQGFEVREFLRSDWPVGWSVPGEIDAANDNHLANEGPQPIQLFGTQRYHVRVELYKDDTSLIPEEVIRSWGVADLKANIDHFPTVRMTAPGALQTPTRVFGLTQLVPPSFPTREVIDQIEELAANDVAFSRLTILRDQIRSIDRSPADLEWTTLDLAGTARWGEDAAAGDLLRAGDRVVVLYEDRGDTGVVDYQDLCLDFVKGAAVRALSDVFIGTGNDIERAAIGSVTATS